MSSYNTNVVVTTGRLTRDPQLYEPTGSTKVYTILPLAINGRDGNGDERTIYYDAKVWNGLARVCVEHLAKGSLVTVTGRLDQFDADSDREPAEDEIGRGERWNYVTADGVEFLGSPRKAAA